MAWPPSPSPGSVLIVSAELANWLVSNGMAQDAALDVLSQQNAAILSELQQLRSLLTDPVSGRVIVKVGEVKPLMPIPVHPTDTLDATVSWMSASGPIRADATVTTWELVDDAGVAVVNGATITVDPAIDEHATVHPPLEGTNALPFTFWLQATTMNHAGAPVVAKSTDSFSVDDTNPVSGTILVTVAP